MLRSAWRPRLELAIVGTARRRPDDVRRKTGTSAREHSEPGRVGLFAMSLGLPKSTQMFNRRLRIGRDGGISVDVLRAVVAVA